MSLKNILATTFYIFFLPVLQDRTIGLTVIFVERNYTPFLVSFAKARSQIYRPPWMRIKVFSRSIAGCAKTAVVSRSQVYCRRWKLLLDGAVDF